MQCRFGHGFGRSLLTILSAVFIDFLGFGCAIATAGWALSNRLLRRTAQHSHAVEQSVEWCAVQWRARRAAAQWSGVQQSQGVPSGRDCNAATAAAQPCKREDCGVACRTQCSGCTRGQAGSRLLSQLAVAKRPAASAGFPRHLTAPSLPHPHPCCRMYAFDVHCNAFFPMFLLLYVLQLALCPVLLMQAFFARVLSAGAARGVRLGCS